MSAATKTPVVLIGGGEHACVVVEALRSLGDQFELRGFVDAQPCSTITARLGVVRLGDDSALSEHADALGVIAVGGMGQPGLRKRLALQHAGTVRGFASVVHAAAWVSPSARLEPGVVVMAGAVVQSGAQLGAHSIVNSGAVVEHDVQLGAYAHLAPRACAGGGAKIGEESFVGLGACVRDHISVGARCTVAMGAVVVRDVSEGQTVKGIPAR